MARVLAKFWPGALVLALVLLTAGALPAVAHGMQIDYGADGSSGGGHVGRVDSPVMQTIMKPSGNANACAAYRQKLVSLKSETGGIPLRYRFIDLTGDGVEEMVVAWWPAIYTYENGAVKRVDSRETGGTNYTKAYKKRKVVVYAVPDHVGGNSYCYTKWNGAEFVLQAVEYTPSQVARSQGYRPYYWTKAKGVTTKKATDARIKKLTGKAKATKLGHGTYKTFS